MLCLLTGLSYLVSAFLAHSSSFSPNLSKSSTVECVLSSKSEFLLVIGIHFVSPWYDPSRLTGRKTASISLCSLLVYESQLPHSHSVFRNSKPERRLWKFHGWFSIGWYCLFCAHSLVYAGEKKRKKKGETGKKSLYQFPDLISSLKKRNSSRFIE